MISERGLYAQARFYTWARGTQPPNCQQARLYLMNTARLVVQVPQNFRAGIASVYIVQQRTAVYVGMK